MTTSGPRSILHSAFFPALLVVLCSFFFFSVFVDSNATVELELEQQNPPEHSAVRIFFAAEGQPWSQLRSAARPAVSGRHHYTFHLGNSGRPARLRIDSHDYRGRVVLFSVKISQSGYRSQTLSGAALAKALTAVNSTTAPAAGEAGVEVRAEGDDPQLLLTPEMPFIGWSMQQLAAPFLLICIVVPLLWFCLRKTAERAAFVPLLLCGIWMLALVMATESPFNAHPDEYVHLAAQQYYTEHWLPPALDDPAIADTYSVYGHSRLNSGEICYLLAGRFTAAIAALQLPDRAEQRAFQLFLLGLILLASLCFVRARLVALPLLLTPQCWYLFSYSNSDAFSLFMAWLAGWQAVVPESLLRRLLFADRNPLWRWLVVGIGGGGLLMIKQNWLPFTALLCLFLLLLILADAGKTALKWRRIRRLALLLLVAAALPGIRFGLDQAANNWQLAAIEEAMQDRYAQPAWHPDTPPEERMPSLGMRAKGVGWKQALVGKGWLEKSFASAFGIFGYTSVSAPEQWYSLVRRAAGCFLLAFLLLFFFTGTVVEKSTALAALVLAGALIVASFHHSWTMDFQPQGRYLFPILSMLGLLCGMREEVLRRRVVLVPVAALCLLGIWFFVFVGLPGIVQA